MDYTNEKGYNFYDLFKKAGLMIETESGEDEFVEEKVRTELGVSVGTISKFVEGYSNPLRGKTFNAVAQYFDIEPARLRAFLRWRADKWQAWEDAGYPDDDHPISQWDDVEDWKGKYLEDELEPAVEENEEVAGFYENEDTLEKKEDEIDDDDGFDLG